MPHTANGHNLEVIHMGYCRDCGGTSLIAGVQAQNVDAAPSPWIAVSERLPTEADANNEGKVWACYRHPGNKTLSTSKPDWEAVCKYPVHYPFWRPCENKPAPPSLTPQLPKQ